MELTFLGTGTSVGVPVIGCDCRVCSSSNPKNHRTRSSIHIQWDDTSIVIDTSVDFRRQMLREDIQNIDFILFTHSHADHIMGLDDVRPFNTHNGKPIDCYGKKDTLDTIRDTFSYIFRETPNNSWKPLLELISIEAAQSIQGVPITPLPVKHGKIDIYGYRIGGLAYIIDVSHIPDTTMTKLDDLEVLVLDGLRDRDHPTHLTIDQALEIAQEIGASKTFLSHMTHDVGYEELCDRLPDNINPAYDGLSLSIENG